MLARVRRVFHKIFDARGAIDLASIMVGVLILGILAAIIAASVIAVVPWSQDNAAVSDIQSVSQTETVNRPMGMTFFAFDNHLASAYRDGSGKKSGFQSPSQRMIIDVSACGQSWVVAHRSATGAVYFRSGGDTTACGDAGPTGTGNPNAEYRVAKGTTVVPAVIAANLPGGIADGVPQAMLDAILNDVPYDFGAVNKPGYSGPALPTYAGETVMGWASSTSANMVSEESALGVRNGMVSVYGDFVNHAAFPTGDANAAAARQSALLVSWEPGDSESVALTQPSYKPTVITSGTYDAYITSWLTTAQSYAENGAVMVRFAPEMNDSGRPWSPGGNGGNTPAEYIAMWKHVYAIKQAVAPQVIFVWNPLNYGASGYTMTQMFPGSAFVDMLALDGFNWSDVRNPGTCGWQSYEDVFQSPIVELKGLAAGKSWGIAEVASAPDKPSDFTAGGPCNSAWGWTATWPANPPYEQTTSDWITQEGWSKMLFKKAHADGALFVNLFHMVKETDWRLSDNAAGRIVVLDAATTGGLIAGDRNAAGFIKAGRKP